MLWQARAAERCHIDMQPFLAIMFLVRLDVIMKRCHLRGGEAHGEESGQRVVRHRKSRPLCLRRHVFEMINSNGDVWSTYPCNGSAYA